MVLRIMASLGTFLEKTLWVQEAADVPSPIYIAFIHVKVREGKVKLAVYEEGETIPFERAIHYVNFEPE